MIKLLYKSPIISILKHLCCDHARQWLYRCSRKSRATLIRRWTHIKSDRGQINIGENHDTLDLKYSITYNQFYSNLKLCGQEITRYSVRINIETLYSTKLQHQFSLQKLSSLCYNKKVLFKITCSQGQFESLCISLMNEIPKMFKQYRLNVEFLGPFNKDRPLQIGSVLSANIHTLNISIGDSVIITNGLLEKSDKLKIRIDRLDNNVEFNCSHKVLQQKAIFWFDKYFNQVNKLKQQYPTFNFQGARFHQCFEQDSIPTMFGVVEETLASICIANKIEKSFSLASSGQGQLLIRQLNALTLINQSILINRISIYPMNRLQKFIENPIKVNHLKIDSIQSGKLKLKNLWHFRVLKSLSYNITHEPKIKEVKPLQNIYLPPLVEINIEIPNYHKESSIETTIRLLSIFEKCQKLQVKHLHLSMQLNESIQINAF
ncbi:hypothetical protein FGO68_gene6027 [Halteria grandinella]|uniref:Uncharacterized protein n=1 Tax=Halteria grandinella TaxID=5974 RepID=A0A8J8P4N8_HALGN|nr:hypothetical protein FGO68_gene6027 [Halteria grandinella]